MSPPASLAIGCCIGWGSKCFRRNPLAVLCILLLVPCIIFVTRFSDVYHASRDLSARMFTTTRPPPPRPAQPSPILIVTAYFPLSKSKHSLYQYNTWLSNFLGHITTDVYMFAPPEMEHSLRAIRGDLPLHLNTSFQTIDHVPVITPLLTQFDAQLALDSDAWKHVPDLYKIWTAKPWFVREAIANVRGEGYGVSGQSAPYQYVFWVDAGSMREAHGFSDWPSLDRVEQTWKDAESLSGRPKDELVFIPMEHAPDIDFVRWSEAEGPVRSSHDFSEGSLFGGTVKAMDWWYDTYFTYFNHYLSTGKFVGNDQLVMNALFFLYSDHFVTVWNRDPQSAFDSGLSSWFGGLGYCGDPWFSYEFFLASDSERDHMNTIWGQRWHWDFWRGHPQCVPERVLSIKGVLQRAFGPNWTSPKPSLP